VNLLSFPARPVNGGNLALSGVRANWLYQPKINGWRAVHCTLTGQTWNRHGSLLSIPLPEAGRKLLAELGKVTDWHWWDLELVERRTKLKGVIIILDVMDSALTLQKRFRKLQSLIPVVGVGEKWNTLSCLPTGSAHSLWQQGLRYNRNSGDQLFEGVVGKKADSLYPIQKTSAQRAYPYWMKHRYAD